jgi:hypothetical protein
LIFLTKLHEALEETQCIQSCMWHFECKIKLAEPKNGTTCPSYKLCTKVRAFKLALGKEKKMLLSHFETVCVRANIFVFHIDNSSRSLTKTLFCCEKFVAWKCLISFSIVFAFCLKSYHILMLYWLKNIFKFTNPIVLSWSIWPLRPTYLHLLYHMFRFWMVIFLDKYSFVSKHCHKAVQNFPLCYMNTCPWPICYSTSALLILIEQRKSRFIWVQIQAKFWWETLFKLCCEIMCVIRIGSSKSNYFKKMDWNKKNQKLTCFQPKWVSYEAWFHKWNLNY